MLDNFNDFFCGLLLLFFSISTFMKKSFLNTIRVLHSLDPDQVPHFVGPDLGSNCLQIISA